MYKVAIIVWSLIVGTCVVANAQDSEAYEIDEDAVLSVPEGCKISVDSMVNVHLVMCDSDVACTQRIVNIVCKVGAK